MNRAGDLAALARSIDGQVITAEEISGADLARGFNARFDDVAPMAMVSCQSAEDVAQAIAVFRRHGLQWAIRGGGHSFAGWSSTTGVLVDLSPMRTVRFSDGVTRLGAGARLGEIYLGLATHGVTIPGGSCPSVGITGLTLGGGIGMLGRLHGLTCDNMVAAEVVLADGSTVRCDAEHHQDLFWALRGAGCAGFGVVTELTFAVLPMATVTVFELAWPFAQAGVVATAWQHWLPDIPDEIAPSLVITADGVPDVPPRVEVFGTLVGSHADATRYVDELVARISGDPSTSRLEEMSYERALRHWAERAGESLDEPRAAPARRSYLAARSEFFVGTLPDDAMASLLRWLAEDRRAGESRELDFTPWGGAYNRVAPDATAFAHRDATFLVKHAAALPADASHADRGAAERWAGQSWATVHDSGTGGVFPNFAEVGRGPWDRAYLGGNLERLLEIKARYDPANLVRIASASGPSGRQP